MGTEARIEQLRKLREEALHSGSRRAVDRQHEQGKLTARERIDHLLDKGSFQEMDMLVRHQASGFGIEAQASARATRLSPATGRSTAARCSSMPKTSRYLEAVSVGRWPTRSAS